MKLDFQFPCLFIFTYKFTNKKVNSISESTSEGLKIAHGAHSMFDFNYKDRIVSFDLNFIILL